MTQARKWTHRPVDQREHLEFNLAHIQLILGKGAKILRRKRTVLYKWCWETGETCSTVKLGPCPTALRNICSKWIKNLNIRPDTIKLEENIGKKLTDTVLGSDFFFLI